MAVRAEQDRFKAAQEIPEGAVVKAPGDLRALQEKFKSLPAALEAEKKSDVTKLATAYIARLEKMKEALTKA